MKTVLPLLLLLLTGCAGIKYPEVRDMYWHIHTQCPVGRHGWLGSEYPNIWMNGDERICRYCAKEERWDKKTLQWIELPKPK